MYSSNTQGQPLQNNRDFCSHLAGQFFDNHGFSGALVGGLLLQTATLIMSMVMGIFYIIWFPTLARDFFRLAKVQP